MRLLPLILGVIIYFHIFFMAFLNQGQSINFSIYGNKPFQLDSELLIVFILVYSAIATSLIAKYFIIDLQNKLKKQLRNTEKASIQSQDSSDKIKNLQAKIDTLEIALKEALKK